MTRHSHYMSVLLLLLIASISHASPSAPRVDIAKDGNALLPILVHPEASDAVKQSANELAEYLGRISGGTFEVKPSDGNKGISLAVAARANNKQLAAKLDGNEPTRREEYIIQSHATGLTLIGATDEAVSHAVWDLLYRFGFRQVVPGDRWEIVPSSPNLSIAIDVYEVPDFKRRRIWNGGGYFPYDKKPYKKWWARNRIGEGFMVGTSHVYDRVVMRNRKVFEEHPEYLGLEDGKRAKPVRAGNKFCISNPSLRQLCVEWAQNYLNRRPHIDGVSMEPSDGSGGWCECEPCLAIGTPSDRAVFLANQVVRALNENSDRTRYVGILAYSAHSPPPTKVKIDKRVVVTVAQGYLRGGYTADELMAIWGKEGVILGTYEYLGIIQWSWDRPGVGRATRRSQYEKKIPKLYRMGVRTFIGESECNFGTSGMGYYAIARTLWDVDEAKRADELYEDFLDKHFGAAKEPMRQYWDMVNGDNRPLLSKDLIGRMYRCLQAALNMTEDTGVRNRITDLILYTRYVDLYFQYKLCEDADAQASYERVMKYAIRIRKHLMIHTREIHRQLHRYDKRVTCPPEAYYRIPYDRNAWTNDDPVTETEVRDWLKTGIETNPLLDFETKTYSLDLVPAAKALGLKTEYRGNFGGGAQTKQVYYTWVEKAPRQLKFTMTAGLIKHYRDRGDARITLYHQSEADDMSIQEERVPPDGKPYPISLTAPTPGLYRIEIVGGGDRTMLEWDTDISMTHIADASARIRHLLNWSLYFYVPLGTKTVGGYANWNTGSMRDSDNKVVFDFKELDGPAFFNVPVPEGQDGKLWRFHKCSTPRLLMTVPPNLARSAEELLLPREVIEAELEKMKKE